MKFPNHPEFTLMLEAVLKALKTLDSCNPEKLNSFQSEVLSKRNNQEEYYKALNTFCK